MRRLTLSFISIGFILLAFGFLVERQTQPVQAQTGSVFYASVNGSPSGTGSISSPWDLATALAKTTTVKPGDTVYVRGGVYHGLYLSDLNGSASAQVTIRNYPGERPIIDGNNIPIGGWYTQMLGIRGVYSTIMGFEIMNSDPHRISQQIGSYPSDLLRYIPGVRIYGSSTKFVNNFVHDAGTGIGVEVSNATNLEVYGNLTFFNGWDEPNDTARNGHGHGLYGQNSTNTPFLIQDNIAFANVSHGFQIYGSDIALLKNFDVDGNILFNNGMIGEGGYQRNLLLGTGGSNPASLLDPVVTNNSTYYSGFGPYDNFGYSGGCTNAKFSNNYFASGGINFINCNVTGFTGNTVFGQTNGMTQSSYPGNMFLPTSGMKGQKITVRPNKYEAGRANIVVYNWDMTPTVSADISQIGLTSGDLYDIYDVQNILGSPIVSGTYNGGSVTLPMTSTAVTQPIGSLFKSTPMQHTSAQFGAFLVMKHGGGLSTTPTPTPTSTVIPTPSPSPVITPTPAVVSVTKSVNTSQATSGAVLTYTLVVKNTGAGTATNVMVSDPIPPGTTYVTNSALPSGSVSYSSSTSTLIWQLSTLAQNASTTLSFQSTVN